MSRITRVQTFARAGFLARGVVYVLLGYFALTTAAGSGTDPAEIFQRVRQVPLGIPLLVAIGIGLACYGLWRLYGAAIDIENSQSGLTAKGRRIGHIASGLGHLLLAFSAVQLALSIGGAGSGDTKQAAAGTLLALPLGGTVLLIVGLGFIAAAFEQGVRAFTAKFMAKMDPDAPSFTEYLGRAGYAARAAVFAAIAWSVIGAALAKESEQVQGIGGALGTLSQIGPLYTLVAIGLLIFGLFSLVMARYRTIRDEDVVARLKSAG